MSLHYDPAYSRAVPSSAPTIARKRAVWTTLVDTDNALDRMPLLMGFKSRKQFYCIHLTQQLRPLTMDASAREAMKDAAKCDKHCELQNSANQ
jgi:hypothetical protein